MKPYVYFAILFFVLGTTRVQATEVRVAVAANFAAPMQKIAKEFARETGYKAILAFGSTGSLYAQIKNGAPFQVFVSADESTPLRAEQEGLAERGSLFTYAVGRLVLWSKSDKVVDPKGELLKGGRAGKLAIANPKLAPYGVAAIQVLDQMGLKQKLMAKFVQGENISQTYQFVASGNAPMGFVALSQVYEDGKIKEGSGWIVPSEMHSPIRQDAFLLKAASGSLAAKSLLEYLRSPTSQGIIRAYGYELK